MENLIQDEKPIQENVMLEEKKSLQNLVEEPLKTHKQRILITESYEKQKLEWPQEGAHILAQFDEDAVVVYQAYNYKLAKYAVENQKFGGEGYNPERMTWIKTNFLWMMFRSGWGDKSNQERTLAIWLKRASFDRILSQAVHSTFESKVYPTQKEWGKAVKNSNIRLQWDPDHHPSGAKHPLRRAIQLGLRNVETFVNGEDILEIQDISDFVKSQHSCYSTGSFETLVTPKEIIYTVKPEIAKSLGVSE